MDEQEYWKFMEKMIYDRYFHEPESAPTTLYASDVEMMARNWGKPIPSAHKAVPVKMKEIKGPKGHESTQSAIPFRLTLITKRGVLRDVPSSQLVPDRRDRGLWRVAIQVPKRPREEYAPTPDPRLHWEQHLQDGEWMEVMVESLGGTVYIERGIWRP